MGTFRRLYFATCVSFVAWSFAAGVGIPIWRELQNGMAGDRSDIAVLSFIAAWLITTPARALTPRTDAGEER
jgi:hypothetical protein